jgi:hypothetical protein
MEIWALWHPNLLAEWIHQSNHSFDVSVYGADAGAVGSHLLTGKKRDDLLV